MSKQLAGAHEHGNCCLCDDLERQLANEKEKLRKLALLTYDLHRRSGHPDSACLRCELYEVING